MGNARKRKGRKPLGPQRIGRWPYQNLSGSSNGTASCSSRDCTLGFRLPISPINQIVYRAEEDGVDLIAVGHRGKGFFEQPLVGSKRVVTRSYCPVLVVR